MATPPTPPLPEINKGTYEHTTEFQAPPKVGTKESSSQLELNRVEDKGTEGDCHVCEKILDLLRPPPGDDGVRMVDLGSGTEVLQPVMGCSQHQNLIVSALRSETSQPDEEIYAMAKNINLVQIHKNPMNLAAIITATMSSGCKGPNLPLYGMYPLKEPGDAEDLVGGRILSSQWIDRDLFKLWKTTCSCLHDDGSCKAFPSESLCRVRPTWLVDVRSQCLTRTLDESSYVALSYVWGNQETLKATVGNICQLQRTGVLSDSPIARTIRDAMEVVAGMAERYLWVDTLCVIQDDASQQQSEMAKMAGIYANATVTILAVQGEHANSGLRGITEPRKLHQSLHYLGDAARVIQFPIEPRHLELITKDSIWKCRGWTFQEDFFSRRRLVFDGDSVRWECAAATWREHVEQSFHLKPLCIERINQYQSLFQPSLPSLDLLRAILSDFNKRSFSYPEDVLLAFAGIAFATGPAFCGGFVSGLPTALFDIALLWQPATRIQRRLARDQKKRHFLPSWSWAGWIGPISFDDRSASDFIRNYPSGDEVSRGRRLTRMLSWKYHLGTTAPGTAIHPSVLTNRDAWLEKRIELANSSGWTKHSSPEGRGAKYESPDPRSPPVDVFYKHDAYPGYGFWYPIPVSPQDNWVPGILAPYISCKTRRAWLFPAEQLLTEIECCPVLSLRANKIWAGILQPHDGLDLSGRALEDPTTPVELVEIAKGLCRDVTDPWLGIEEIRHPERPKTDGWYEYYWVMWIGWADGIAYRKGLGRVRKDIWEEQRGESFGLMLG